MAMRDYRLCDVCGGKVFYDANLNYDFDQCNDKGEPKLDYLGDWAIICVECAKDYKCVVIKKEPSNGQS
jgi:hypothetical protein